ncbi:MAG: AAA family ATPase [Oscillospiraceae bacterium]|jgi:type II secretory pathway predicted ATPase ExeA|nr:AAA family ATPase [Oscillospiraceae bacterium]
MSNPFNPSFGKRPIHFYGRQEITRSIVSSVGDENSPWRTTLITGVRGSGKTALLSDIRANLDNLNIVTLYLVPNEAIFDSVLSQLYRQLPKTISNSMPEFKGISINLRVSIDFEKESKLPRFTETFSYQIMELMDAHMKQGKHIVFLIDETQKHTEDMRIFISIYQDLIMREYSVSMVLAGLPAIVSDILNDDVLTFLRRAKRVELENVDLMIVKHEFKKVFLGLNASLTEKVIHDAAVATYGYPYLIQLVGYYLWEDAQNGDNDDVLNNALINSKAELFRNVHGLVFAVLSNRDRDFLFAMSEDEGASSVSLIGERMQKKKNFISLYRERLISAGIIKSAGRGLLCFSYPYMREFLHTVTNCR